MQNRKKKILFIGEATFLSTGYSVLGYELLSRLHKTGKYEIAELGCFATVNDPRQHQLPWKFYGNMPNPNDKAAVDFYYSKQEHAFGSWRFEEIAFDYKPDICIATRDYWCDEFLERSPYRPYYHLILMPPVDAIPQHPQWLSTFMNADAVFTYTDWALSVLNETKGLINTIGTASPGVDLKIFQSIQDKGKHKMSMGLPSDSFIIGTVMRNQKRKLFPDLIKSFKDFLEKAPKEIAERSYLYMHTSYPDWWDIPSLLMEYGVGHRCLFTYKCKACKYAFPSFYQDARSICPNCHRQEAYLPNTHLGTERPELASIYNLFDVYVQYANSEGFGIPLIEAGSCGIPVMAIDYSAMSDVVRKLKGYPIDILTLAREADTGCNRAIPNNVDFVDKLIKFAQLPESWKKKKGFEARKGVETYFDWDKNAKIWEKYIDSVPLRDLDHTWTSPAKLHEPSTQIPEGLTNDQFVQWALINIAGRPDLLNHYMAIRLTRDLQWGSTTEHTGDVYFNELSAIGIRAKRRDFSRGDVVNELTNICNYKNFWERRRTEKLQGEVK